MNGLMLMATIAAGIAGWAICLAALVVANAMRAGDGRWLAGAGWICTSVVGFVLGLQPDAWITEANWPLAILAVSLAMVLWQNIDVLRRREARPGKRPRATPILIAAALGLLVLLAPPARAAELKLITGSNDLGAWAVVFEDDGYTILPATYVLRWEAATPGLRDDLVQLANVTDKAATAAALAKKHGTLHISDASLHEVYAGDAAKIAAASPPAPVWRVPKLGAATDRPAYRLTDGVRSKTSRSGERAIVGAVCDAWTRVVEGDTVYALVADGLVAICKRDQ